MIDLWVEKYRPTTISDYVFKDDAFRESFTEWVSNPKGKDIPFPHLLLSGKPGTGKTSAAKLLLKELNVDEFDILSLNGSKENGKDTFETKVMNFCYTYPNGKYKVVLLDEGDKLTPAVQDSLKNEMETLSDSVRFIITCNNPEKITDALKSRFQEFHFNAVDPEQFIMRMIDILVAENVSYKPEQLDAFFNNSYPDLRKCINLLDQHVTDNTLRSLMEETSIYFEYMTDVVRMIKNKDYTNARKKIVANALPTDYEEIYTFLYKNLQLFSSTEEGQGDAIVIIADGLIKHKDVADAEINLASTLVKLSRIDR